MNILISGIDGFIGSHLADFLLNRGHSVSGIVEPGKPIRNIGHDSKNISLVESDMTEIASLRNVCCVSPDIVIHLASANAYDSTSSDIGMVQYMEGNGVITTNILEICKTFSNLKMFFNISSSIVYYGRRSWPARETSKIRPVAPYAFSKWIQEEIALLYHRAYDLPIVNVRLFGVYGPREHKETLIASAIQSAINNLDFKMTSGLQTKDFMYVHDVSRILELLLFACDKLNGQTINVGTGTETRIIDIVRFIFEIAKSRGKPLPGTLPEPNARFRRHVADIAKLKQLIGDIQPTDVYTGLEAYVDYQIASNH